MELLTFPLSDRTRLVLRGKDYTAETLSSVEDGYFGLLGSLELSARAQCDITLEAFVDHVAAQALDWPDTSLAVLKSTFEELRELLKPFERFLADLPEEIDVLLTTGREEAGAAGKKVSYCRGLSSIIVSVAYLDKWAQKPQKAVSSFLHQLWHLFTRNAEDTDVLDGFCALFGFKRLPKPLEHPAELLPVKYTNPDAPYNTHYIEVEGETKGEVLPLVPLLLLKDFSPASGESLLDHVSLVFGVVRLFEVEREDGETKHKAEWVTGEDDADEEKTNNNNNNINNNNNEAGSSDAAQAQSNGDGDDNESASALLIAADEIPYNFWQQVSQNTAYITHIEEIVAENFVACVVGRKDVQDVQKLEKIREMLK